MEDRLASFWKSLVLFAIFLKTIMFSKVMVPGWMRLRYPGGGAFMKLDLLAS